MEAAKFSPRKYSRKIIKCVVKGCESTSEKNLEVRFHMFPIPGKRFVYIKNSFGNVEKTDQLEAWMKLVKTKKVNSSMRVCSLHFRKDDYILPDIPAKRRYLKTIAVPSCNLPNSGKTAIRVARIGKIWERNVEENMVIAKIYDDRNFQMEEHSQEHYNNQPSKSCEDIEDPLAIDKKYTSIGSKSLTTAGCSIHSENNFPNPKIIDLISSDAELKSLTGIETFAIFNTIVEIVTNTFGVQPEESNTGMSIHDKVLMCYIKLKQNMAYNCLAIMSQCSSAKTCQQIFIDTIKSLSACLRSMIKWPSREEISENLPHCFKACKDVRVILYCTKVFIQQSKNHCQRNSRFMDKRTCTCKFLTGVTPAGKICYVSKFYDDRTSDKTKINYSGIANLLEPGDAVMIDRTVNIDDECILHKWKCYNLPFMKEKKQLTNTEATVISKKRKAEVYVERSNQRIKTFRIIREIMPRNLLPVIEDIFIVICATVNLESRTIKDEKHMGDVSSEQ